MLYVNILFNPHFNSIGVFHGGSVVKNPCAKAGDMGSISDSRRFPGEGNSNPFQYSCLRNPMNRRAWQAAVHGGHKRVRQDLATKTTTLWGRYDYHCSCFIYNETEA